MNLIISAGVNLLRERVRSAKRSYAKPDPQVHFPALIQD